MSLILDGSNGLSDVDGTAATPAIRGTDANTGIFFPAADTIAFSEGGTESMRINSSGNVGVGTTNPSAPLDVVSNSSALGFLIRGRSSDDIGKMSFTNNANSTIYASIQSYSGEFSIQGIANAPTVFYTNNTERMRVTSGGDLLVGTTSGSYGSFSGRVVGNASSGGAALFYTSYSGDLSNAALNVGKFDNNATTSQVYVRFGFNNGGLGGGQINGNGSGAAAFGGFSDRRLKENIVDLPSQLDNILALRPVEFDYIESVGGGHQTGFVAQEMQEVYPDAVGEREPDGMLTVTGWSKTEARLVKAIQELKATVDAQAARIAALEAK
jgi:hypothetical protein